MKRTLQLLAGISLLLFFSTSAEAVRRDSKLFPEPASLEDDIGFWIRIYTEIETGSGLIHDSRNLGVVYEEMDYPRGLSSKRRDDYTEKRKQEYQSILRRLARGKRKGLNRQERRVLELFPRKVSNSTLRSAARNIRFQLGQADRFRDGLIRSGAYANHIRATLESMGLPPQLSALPHVESSYTPHAYSRVGAAGLWQFTRSTGRRFMRIDSVIDERLDPYLSSVAAARLLEQNRRVTGSWPLAITAYNHGASGMRRAVKSVGSRDISRIVRKYKSRTFGFASRNFYVEFLAALRIAENPEKYFGKIKKHRPIEFDRVRLPFYTTPQAISRALGVSLSKLKASNPALLDPVWRGQKRVPEDFAIKVPRASLKGSARALLASIPNRDRFSSQIADTYHVVRRGESLSKIAHRYGTSVAALQSLNHLRNRHHIRVGQKLILPLDPSQKSASATVRKNEKARIPSDRRHRVRSGDTLAAIARRYGVQEADLIRINGIRNRDLIQLGQLLKLPGPDDTSWPQSNGQHSLDPASSATHQALLADPTDYLVADDESIEVQIGETLGHYAQWLEIRAQELRSLNRMKRSQDLRVHSRLELDFRRVTPRAFEERRIKYHRSIQEDFFVRWEIVGTDNHTLRPGDSLWALSRDHFKLPIWLLQQYNPDIDFASATAGTEIRIPQLRRRS